VTVRDAREPRIVTQRCRGADPVLREHLEKVRLRHQEDLKVGFGSVYRRRVGAQVSERGAGVALAVCFSRPGFIQGSQDGVMRRHHLDEATIHRAIKTAVARVGIQKT